jgi:tautomerase-like protein
MILHAGQRRIQALREHPDNARRRHGGAEGRVHPGRDATTFVIIDEAETNNWGVGGESTTVIRRRQK